jgi:FdhD protein
METSRPVDRTLWSDGRETAGTRVLAEETPVAISYNGSTHAVLMATPADLEDLGVGFTLTEGIVYDIAAIESVTVATYDLGLDVQVRVRQDIADRLARRRRSMAGPVGCGLCGLESLEAASRQLPPIHADARFACSDIAGAARSLAAHQDLNRRTAAAHAAGFFRPREPVSLVREDVGRHNALDKLIGALLLRRDAIASGGFVLTSRISVELVQKAAIAGAGLIAGISAPTALAVRTADAAGLTLAAVVRGATFEVFTRPERVTAGMAAHVG